MGSRSGTGGGKWKWEVTIALGSEGGRGSAVGSGMRRNVVQMKGQSGNGKGSGRGILSVFIRYYFVSWLMRRLAFSETC